MDQTLGSILSRNTAGTRVTRCARLLLYFVLASIALPAQAETDSHRSPHDATLVENSDDSTLTEEQANDLGAAAGSEKEGEETEEDDLLNLDLDQLTRADVVTSTVAPALTAEVTSVTRTAQPIARTGSAVFVVTNEMIHRSGARNIPEVLRMVPGVHVARINSQAWAISIRGFNDQFANKLLIQIDGRAVYSPTFSGTFWDHQFVPLHDVDRIEVIRGPGGTVWGANAVNGVINIVTKDSSETQGLYTMVGGGSEHQLFSHVRVGGQVGDVSYRFYGMQTEDDYGFSNINPPMDGRDAGQGGFRVDWTPNRRDTLTIQGDVMRGTSGYAIPTAETSSSNIMGRWTRKIDANTDWSVQLYYSEASRNENVITAGVGQVVSQEIFDLDATYHMQIGNAHDVVCGFGFRDYQTNIAGFGGYDIFPINAEQFDVISYFVQDTWTLLEDRWFMTLGSKMEHNDFVGFVYQPSVKLAHTPNERTSIWASVGRAVRTPSRLDRDLNFQLPGTIPAQISGSRAIEAEEVLTYELGMRRQPSEYFYWDAAVFYSRYDNLINYSITGVTTTLITAQSNNDYAGETYGGELWGTLTMTDNWRMRGYYAYLGDAFTNPANTLNGYPTNTSPRNMVYLTSSHDLSRDINFDATLRYADNLSNGTKSYLVADLRLAYQPFENLEFALVGQNLFDNKHFEFQRPLYPSTEVESGVYGMMSWSY